MVVVVSASLSAWACSIALRLVRGGLGGTAANIGKAKINPKKSGQPDDSQAFFLGNLYCFFIFYTNLLKIYEQRCARTIGYGMYYHCD